ncbi:DM13 domain-containing protein [Bacillus coahuilensis]|uniref:DM13 domain-containing protein n=1 Tax=Bacillus coahuilensis TaxID=408580 RepID=UPI0001850965|nr:DM13 domain-containing protein [Bacillus coahuilensis]
MKKALLIGGSLVAIFIAWYLVSPLFIDKVVDEAPPEQTSPSQTEEPMESEEIMQMEESEKEESTVSEEESPITPTLMTGTFKGADANHDATGNVLAQVDGDNPYIRFEEFEATNGPDLYVYVVKEGQKTSEGVSLGKLKGNIGNQNYDLPQNLEIEEGDQLVIWCKQFDVDFGYAQLIKGE